jgi:hypothetical protein
MNVTQNASKLLSNMPTSSLGFETLTNRSARVCGGGRDGAMTLILEVGTLQLPSGQNLWHPHPRQSPPLRILTSLVPFTYFL